MKTLYSHAFFTGGFNGNVKPDQLDSSVWIRGETPTVRKDAYSYYYKGHVDAMMEFETKRPEFLRDVCHYRRTFVEPEKGSKGKRITLRLTKKEESVAFDYTFLLMNIHLYFFPLDTVMVAIEIDDSGNDLDDLTAAHSAISNNVLKKPDSKELKEALSVLTPFISKENGTGLLKDGSKFKLFQIIHIDSDDIPDALLYETASSSPIGCIGTDHRLAPSFEYFHDNVIKNHKISVFDNWKALAITDSFTIVSNDRQNPGLPGESRFYMWISLYYPLIYLRCLLEKTFCVSRNTAYRMDRNIENLNADIAEMEKYYFYNNISHNFLPNLLYEAMAKGMGLQSEREELSEQVRERAHEERVKQKEAEEKLKEAEAKLKEAEERRSNMLAVLLSGFAIFSVVWDLCSMTIKAFPKIDSPWTAAGFLLVGIIGFILLMDWFFRKGWIIPNNKSK